MTLADEIKAEIKTPGVRCLTCRIIEQLGDDGPELADILAGDEYGNDAIARALTKRGHRISAGALRNHRARCVTY